MQLDKQINAILSSEFPSLIIQPKYFPVHAFIGMVYCPPMYFPTIVCSQQVNHMHRECLVHAGSELMLAALPYSSPGSRLSPQNRAVFEESLGTQLA